VDQYASTHLSVRVFANLSRLSTTLRVYICLQASYVPLGLSLLFYLHVSLPSPHRCPVPCLAFILFSPTRLTPLSCTSLHSSYFSSTSYAGSVIVAAACDAAASFLLSSSRSLSMTSKAAVASHVSMRQSSSITSSVAGLKVGRSTTAAANLFASVKTDGRLAYLMEISRLPVLCAFVIHEST